MRKPEEIVPEILEQFYESQLKAAFLGLLIFCDKDIEKLQDWLNDWIWSVLKE